MSTIKEGQAITDFTAPATSETTFQLAGYKEKSNLIQAILIHHIFRAKASHYYLFPPKPGSINRCCPLFIFCTKKYRRHFPTKWLS